MSTHKVPFTLFLAILLFATLAHVTTDIYVPSMPFIMKAFHSTPRTIQLTLFSFLIGYSIAHLFYGPLSDRIGRRKPLLSGIGLMIIGTIICITAVSTDMLILGRFVQGIGVAVCNSVGRSLIRDLFTGNYLAKMSSHLGMVIVFVIATAPTLGAYIQSYSNWRTVFIVLLLYAVFIWIYTLKILPETNLRLNKEATRIKTILCTYLFLLKNKTFMGYTLCVSFAYAGLFAFVTGSPFLFQTVMGLSAIEYGYLSMVIGLGVFISFFLNGKFVILLGFEKMISIGSGCMLFGGLLMLAFKLIGLQHTFFIMFPTLFFCIGAGFTFSNGFAGASQPFPQIAGSVGALFGCLQILGGAVASGIMAHIKMTTQLPLAVIFTSLGLLSLLSFYYLAKTQL